MSYTFHYNDVYIAWSFMIIEPILRLLKILMRPNRLKLAGQGSILALANLLNASKFDQKASCISHYELH